MRARYPDVEGFVERDGIKVGYEVYGSGPATVVLTPVDLIVHSRAWKAQIPYLSRFYRVVAIDARGNGRSDRPHDAAALTDLELVADTLAVMDEVGVDRAVLGGLCSSNWIASVLAAEHPDRVAGIFALSGGLPYLTPPLPHRVDTSRMDPLDTDEGWAKDNVHYWRRDWRGFVEFFFDQLLPEPHSTKQWEDCVGWALEVDLESMIAAEYSPLCVPDQAGAEALLGRIECPVLAVHGSADMCQPQDRSERFAELTGGRFIVLEGAGHLPQAREPVLVNRLFRAVRRRRDALTASRCAGRGPMDRPRKVLIVSSPIGLGHTRRDLAIAEELQALRPGIQVDWLAQPPVSDVAAARGQSVHPASAFLASEVDHIESESAEHDLHAFQAIRKMDEILVNNFMVFDELVRNEHYDAWVADEGWDVDYFLHENPELKSSAYVWLTDFVGWLPMPDGGEPERRLTSDYNAEMVEHVARFPRLRDRALFVGDPDDCVPDGLGDGLPSVRAWTEETLRLHRLHHRVPAAQRRRAARGPGRAGVGRRREGRRSRRRGDGGRCSAAAPGGGGVPARRCVGAGAADGRRGRPAHRPGVAVGTGRSAGARVRTGPLPDARRQRPRGRPGRADHVHGAGRQPQAVPVRPSAAPLRADVPRHPPAGALRRRQAARLRRHTPRSRSPPRSRRRSAGRPRTCPSPPTGRPGRHGASPS